MSYVGDNTISFSEEQGMLMDVAREFCRDQSSIEAVRSHLETDPGYDTGVWQQMVELGWTGIALPEEYGGSGLGIAELVPVLEAMGRSLLGTPFLSSVLAAQLVLRAGDAGQREQLLPSLAAGQAATLALQESPDWGSEAINATLSAEGVLSGIKVFVQDAAASDLFVVSAKRDGKTVLAVVERGALADGAIAPNTLMDQTRRSATVSFEGAKATTVIAGDTVEAALRDVRLIGALLVAAEAVGSNAASLDLTVDYLKTRKQFGNLIGSYQSLKHPSVEILNAMESARSFVYRAASVMDGDALSEEAEIACRMAKAQATDSLLFASDRGVQFHGGMGFTYECDASLYCRRAQWVRQQFGDALHHRKHLARLLLD